MYYKVVARQLVEIPSDPADRDECNLGLNGTKDWFCHANDTEGALDQYHEHHAIGCLEDYEFTAIPEQDTAPAEHDRFSPTFIQ